MIKEKAEFQLSRPQSSELFAHLISFISPIFLFSLGLIFLFLSGCATAVKLEDPEAIRSGKIAALSEKLESFGTRVIQTGQTVRIILPSDQIFNPHSANLTSKAIPVLDTVSRLMILVETTSAQVSGYTDVEPMMIQNKALSARQAQVVSDYLWSRGIDTRLLYSVGYGANGRSFGIPGNFGGTVDRRIEIKFQYLPLLSSLVN